MEKSRSRMRSFCFEGRYAEATKGGMPYGCDFLIIRVLDVRVGFL